MATAESNKERIKENKQKLFLLEHKVLNNKAKAYLTRDVITENRSLIQKNYEAAFHGNRQLANSNTDATFRNRIAVIKNSIHSSEQVHVNQREALLNEAKIDFLDHRSKITERVNHVNEELAAINARLIAINAEVITTNEEIVKFNHHMIESNSAWNDKGVDPNPTPEKNVALIAKNSAKIIEITARAEANAKKNHEVYEQTKVNHANLEVNSASIAKRREEIEANSKLIHENAVKIAAKITLN